jgi:hypothetical protein
MDGAWRKMRRVSRKSVGVSHSAWEAGGKPDAGRGVARARPPGATDAPVGRAPRSSPAMPPTGAPPPAPPAAPPASRAVAGTDSHGPTGPSEWKVNAPWLTLRYRPDRSPCGPMFPSGPALHATSKCRTNPSAAGILANFATRASRARSVLALGNRRWPTPGGTYGPRNGGTGQMSTNPTVRHVNPRSAEIQANPRRSPNETSRRAQERHDPISSCEGMWSQTKGTREAQESMQPWPQSSPNRRSAAPRSQLAVHHMKPHTTQRRMRESARNRADDGEAQSPVDLNGGVVRFRHGVELHAGVALLAGPVEREAA